MVWAASTMTLWRDNYVLPGIESSLTPPDQWRDKTCECAENDTKLVRGSRALKKMSKQKDFENQLRSLFDQDT